MNVFRVMFEMFKPFFLPVVLVALIVVNLQQWRNAAVEAARNAERHASEVELAREQGRRQAADERAEKAEDAANRARIDLAETLEAITRLAEATKNRIERYNTTIGALPPPACAPGAERVDAINALLEPK